MKRSIAILLILAVALPLTVAVVSGCGGMSAEEAKAKFEDSLKEMKSAFRGMADPTIYTDADKFKAALEDLEKAYDNVIESAGDLKDIEVTDLKKAWNDFKKAVGDITGDRPLTEKLSAIQSSLVEISSALQRLYSTFDGEK